ncbi:hypothetical protein C922_00306 [Plasmodium inui San Antonio 1]|uniref:Hpc2-related domain-containing protein n=1 Tax=Plasmodium inui San Antonio 1 TaxID=1237626 RepID=W7ADQ1_9APIC|nr:hypothetical protein C922_00306 [Plasmodium inui San Antonio 1]EUD69443.1 hypothetical protein C922_00306 [Plasmodium inui San Antonio 1]
MATIEKSNQRGEHETEAFYKNERKGKTNKIESSHVNEEKKEVEIGSFHNVENKSENNAEIFGISVSKNEMDMNNNNLPNPVMKRNVDMEKPERKSGLIKNKSSWETEEENLLHDEANLSDEGEEVEEENVIEKDLILQRYKHGTNIFVNLGGAKNRCILVDFYSECLNKYKNECNFVYYQSYNSSSNIIISENVDMMRHVPSTHFSCENMESMGNMPISNDKTTMVKGKNAPKNFSSIGMGVGTSVVPGEDFKNFNLQKKKQESLDPLLKCINSLSDRINLQHLVGDPTTYFKVGGGDMFYDINDPFLDDEEMYKELNKTKNEIILTRQIEDEYSVWSADMSDDYVDINPDSFISFYSSKCKYVYSGDEKGEENKTKWCTSEVKKGKEKRGDQYFCKHGDKYKRYDSSSSSCSDSSDESVIELNQSHMGIMNYQKNIGNFIIYSSSEEDVEASSSEDENGEDAEESEGSEEDIIFNPFAWKKFQRHIPPEFFNSFEKLEKELDALPLEVNIEDIQAIIKGNIHSIFVQVKNKQKNMLNHFDKTLDDYVDIDIKQLRWLTTIMNKTSNVLNDIDICRIWFEHLFHYNIMVFINGEKEFVSKIKNSQIFEKNNKTHLNGILKDISSWRSFQEYKEKLARQGALGTGATIGGATIGSTSVGIANASERGSPNRGPKGPKTGSSPGRGASKAAIDRSKNGIAHAKPSCKEAPESEKLIDARDAGKEKKSTMLEMQGKEEAANQAKDKASNNVPLKAADSPKSVPQYEGNVECVSTPQSAKVSAVKKELVEGVGESAGDAAGEATGEGGVKVKLVNIKNEHAEGNCDSVSMHFSNNSTIEQMDEVKVAGSDYSCAQNSGLSKKECAGENGKEAAPIEAQVEAPVEAPVEALADATIDAPVDATVEPTIVAADPPLTEQHGEKTKGSGQNSESYTDLEPDGPKASKSANRNGGQKEEEYQVLEIFFQKFVDISYDILNYVKMFIKQKCFLKDMISAGFEALVEKHNKHFVKLPHMTVSEILTNLFNFRYKTSIIIAPDYVEALVEFYQNKYKVDISYDKSRYKKVFLFDTNEMHKLNNAYYRSRNSAKGGGVVTDQQHGKEGTKGKLGGKGQLQDKGNNKKGGGLGSNGSMASNDLLLVHSKGSSQNAGNKKQGGGGKNGQSSMNSAMGMKSKASSTTAIDITTSGASTGGGNDKVPTKKRRSDSIKHSLTKETNSLTKKKQNKMPSNDLSKKNSDKKKSNKNEKKMGTATHIIICSDEESQEKNSPSIQHQVMTKMANQRDKSKGEFRNISMLIEDITKKKCSTSNSSVGSIKINRKVGQDQRRAIGSNSYVGQPKGSLSSMPSMQSNPSMSNAVSRVSNGQSPPQGLSHSTLPRNNKLQTVSSIFSNYASNHHNSMNSMNNVKNVNSVKNINSIHSSSSICSAQRKRATEENLLIIPDEQKNLNSNVLNEKMKLYKKRKMKNDPPCGKQNAKTNILKLNKVNEKMKGKVLHSNDKCAVYKCINIDTSDENK